MESRSMIEQPGTNPVLDLGNSISQLLRNGLSL
jgi:hypothetical protein